MHMYIFLMYMFEKYFLDMLGVSKIAMPNRMIKLLSYFSFCDFLIFSTEIPTSYQPPSLPAQPGITELLVILEKDVGLGEPGGLVH